MLASSGGLKIEKRPMWSGVERRDPFIRLANNTPFKAEDRIMGLGDLAVNSTSSVWGHNGSEYLAILPGQLPRTVSSDFKTTTVRSVIGAAPTGTDRFKILGYTNGNWIVEKYVSGSSTILYRSPDNGVTWVMIATTWYSGGNAAGETILFGDKIYIYIPNSTTVNVYSTSTWTALANETLPDTLDQGYLRKSNNGNVLVCRMGSTDTWYKKIGTGSWTACPYIAEQVSTSLSEIVALGESDFIFFDANYSRTKRISRWSPTTDTLTFLPNFSLEVDMPRAILMDNVWVPITWPWQGTPHSFIDIDGITHIPVKYQKTFEYYYNGSALASNYVYVFAILSTYTGESFTMTEVGRIDESKSGNYGYLVWPAIGGGFFYTDLENRVNTINTNCQEIVHVL